MKIYTNELSHITNMAAMPIYGKNLKKSSPEPLDRKCLRLACLLRWAIQGLRALLFDNSNVSEWSLVVHDQFHFILVYILDTAADLRLRSQTLNFLHLWQLH